jgi:hypothetical protein
MPPTLSSLTEIHEVQKMKLRNVVTDLSGLQGKCPMIRLRVLLALLTVLFLAIVSLAAVLSVAEVMAALGNSAAAATFRYIGLGTGCVAVITLLVLVVWISLVLVGELIRQEAVAEPPSAEQQAAAAFSDQEQGDEHVESQDAMS